MYVTCRTYASRCFGTFLVDKDLSTHKDLTSIIVVDVRKRETGSTNLVICIYPPDTPGYLQEEVIPPLPKGSMHPKRCQGMVHEWLIA